MCDSMSTSEILTGASAVTLAPPLILLQSEEESGTEGRQVNTDNSAGTDAEVAGSAAASQSAPPETSESSAAWSNTQAASSGQATSASPDAWNLDQVLAEDKNPFSGLTEEHLSRLDDVLSSEEVRNFLQQTNLSELEAGLVDDPATLTPSSSTTGAAVGAPQPSTSGHSLNLFDSQASDPSLQLDQALAHHFIQDSVREHELAVMAAAFNDHAYALPSANTDTTMFSPQRKSARIKQRIDDGKNAFDSDSDFEYYFVPKRTVKKDTSDLSDAEKASSSPAPPSSPAPSSPAPSTSGARTKQPKRRSTRITDLENREKAEKILQENRQKEQELKAALQQEQEAAKTKDETEEKEEQEEEESPPVETTPPAAKRGRKKGMALKGKKGKQNETEEASAADDNPESEDSSKPKAQPAKPRSKKAILVMKRKKKAAMSAEEKDEEKEETDEAASDKKKGIQQQKKKRMQGESEAGRKFKGFQGRGKKMIGLKAGLKGKRKLLKTAGKTPSGKKRQESSDEDDIPLKAIAKTHNNADGKTEGGEGGTKKEKKTEKGPTKSDKGAGVQKKRPGKGEQRHRSLSAGNEGKVSTGHGDRKKDGHKSNADRRLSKGEGEAGTKGAERRASKGEVEGTPKIADKTKSAGAGGKAEETTHSAKTPKHKHRKSEEIIIDPTVTDLFKPDGVIPTEHFKKESETVDTKDSKNVFPGSAHLGSEGKQAATVSQQTTEVKNGAGTQVQKRSVSTESPRSFGDAGPDKKSGVVRQVSLLTKQPVSLLVKQSAPGGTVVKQSTPGGTVVKQLVPSGTVVKPSTSGGTVVKPTTPGGTVVKQAAPHGTVVKQVTSETTPAKQFVPVGTMVKHVSPGGTVVKQVVTSAGTPLKEFVPVGTVVRHITPTGTVIKQVAADGTLVVAASSPVSGAENTTATQQSSAEGNAGGKGAQKVVYVSLKAEKGSVKIIHSQAKEHRQSTEKDGADVSLNLPKDSAAHPKEEEKEGPPHKAREEAKQPKEERKSLFEVLLKPETAGEEHKYKPLAHDGKEKHESSEKKHKPHKGRKGSKDDGHESGDLSWEDDENDSDWEPANDNDTVYCICRRPHGNRFMICCDQCGEWYHGQCVGLSKQQGKQLEEENKDYICPVCTGSHVMDAKMIKQEADKRKPGEKKEKKPPPPEARRKIRESLEDPKLIKRFKGAKDKWKSGRCVSSECKRTARLGSVFCSNSCIVHHAREALRLLRRQKERVTGKKIMDVRPSEKDHVIVMEQRSGRVLQGSNAPTEAQLELWLQTHPSYEAVLPSLSTSSSSSHTKKEKDRRTSSTSSTSSKKSEVKTETVTPVKKEEKPDDDSSHSKSAKPEEGPERVRLNVRKSLRDALAQRAEEADDIVLAGSEIKRMALRIEEELFKVYANTGHKYRAKFRSLLFNIKDQKNKGLFRKILTRKIRSSHLVKMSTEELASKELARWRKMETKHTLAMIEQTEKAAMKAGQHHIRKKTHKGEVEVADEDMSTLVTQMEEQKPKADSKAEETVSSALVDTTDQHRAHLFDLNCKICTGKMLPPVAEEAASTPKVKVSHKVKEEKKKEEKKKKKGVSIKKGVRITDDVTVKELKEEDREEREEREKEEEKEEGGAGMEEGEETAEEVVQHALEHVKAHTAEAMAEAAAAAAAADAATSSSSSSSSSKVTVRSPDSALQSGLDPKHKFTPSGPMAWKGFISMQDFAKFFTSAYRVSGPVQHLGLPDTLQICGRIVPDQMWDYLGKIRQAGSRDICIVRFIPGSDDEKVTYVHLYSYLNSRGRCGVVGNVPKHIKDLYIVPLASHGKISQVLLPFDGPGLEGNRPHMLIGIIVRQKLKRRAESSDSPASSKSAGSSDKHQGKSSTKKPRVAKDEETEAYSPTADGEEISGAEALYIPTPTTVTVRAGSSASSSSTSTPSSFTASSGKDPASKQTPPLEDAEPYSPSKAVVADDEDVPYDPEDAGTFDDDDDTPTAATTPAKDTATQSKTTAVTTSVTVAAPVTSTPAVAPVSTPSAVSTTVDIDSVMEKISASNDPEEISSIMVATLAKAKDSAEQQRLLATLTARVEQQKKLKAGKPASEGSSLSDTAKMPPAVAPSTDTAETSATVAPSTAKTSSTATPSADAAKPSAAVLTSTDSVKPSSELLSSVTLTTTAQSDIKAAIAALTAAAGIFSSGISSAPSTSVTASSTLPSATVAAAVTMAAQTKIIVGESVSSSAPVVKPTEPVSRISTLTPDTENMPLALKALMEELKGNTQMARAVDKRTDRREWEKKEAAAAGKEGGGGGGDKTQSSAGDKTQQGSKLSESFIPGLGGVKDEGDGQEEGEEGKVSERKDKCDEVTSSTDSSQKEKPKSLEEGLVTSSSLAASDSRQFAQVKDTLVLPSALEVLPPQDQDDRFPPHPSLPAPVPPPSVSAGYPPSHTPFMMASHPLGHPPMDVGDIDHRRHPHAPPIFPAMGMMPHTFPPRPAQQPPPPGTELVGEADVDMRQATKRPGPLLPDPVLGKLPRTDTTAPSSSSHGPPPLPPLPPQPPPPLPPLPSASGSKDSGLLGEAERYERPGGGRHSQERWRREGGQDYDHRRHHPPDPHSRYSPGSSHHHHHHRRSASPSHRYRQDRDDRHRRDHHRDRH